MKRDPKITGDMNGLLSPFLIKKRMEVVIPFIRERNKILDVGCGVFRWKDFLPDGIEYMGVDFEDTIIEYNRMHFKQKFIKADLEKNDIGSCGANFDLILMLAVIEHFDNPVNVLKGLHKVLSEKGVICLTTPHVIGNLILNWGAKIKIFSQDKHQHHELLNYRKIKKLAYESGFKLIKYKRFLYGFNQLVILEKKN
ncbi:MAG: methyltransferase domain-containing protein [Candidatus Aureabacteria bacterium]|nr:methyltransferase domain-containing protein [Candidatus Auribacterota bacterium]